jgi:hypothetical protein
MLDEICKTKIQKIVIYFGLAGMILCIISFPVPGLRGIVLALAGVALVVPMLIFLHSVIRQLERERWRIDTKIIVLETLEEIVGIREKKHSQSLAKE